MCVWIEKAFVAPPTAGARGHEFGKAFMAPPTDGKRGRMCMSKSVRPPPIGEGVFKLSSISPQGGER